MVRKITAYGLMAAVAAAGLIFLTYLFTPKYMGTVVEGAMIAEYYDETSSHDVIFIGDCEVYENFSPITLWEDYGITSYIRGSAEQMVWQSYYLLEDTLSYETPKVVVFNVLAMKADEPRNEAYNRMTMDGMRWSTSKAKAVQTSMKEDEHFIEYVMPLLRYHSRWSELEREDWTYLFQKDKVSHNGYYMRADIKPAGTFPADKKLGNYQFSDKAYQYLDKITSCCKENGIQLILIKAPSIYPSWYDQWDQQIEDYAREHQIGYYNFRERKEEIGLDFQTDTYDGGLHLNVSGAEKLSRYLGEILKNQYGLEDHREDGTLADIWTKKNRFYYDMKEKQKEDIEKYGYIRKFHGEQDSE